MIFIIWITHLPTLLNTLVTLVAELRNVAIARKKFVMRLVSTLVL